MLLITYKRNVYFFKWILLYFALAKNVWKHYPWSLLMVEFSIFFQDSNYACHLILNKWLKICISLGLSSTV